MTEPIDGRSSDETPGLRPESERAATQSIPSSPNQAGPGAYQYPVAAGSAGAPEAPSPASADTGVDLADEVPATTSGRRGGKRTGLLVGGLAAVLVLGGGAVFAAQKLGGGGAQPAEVLPGDAYAYFRLDVDPSAAQKVSAVRFLGQLPQVKDTVGSGDPRAQIWKTAIKDDKDGCLSKLDYAKDIEPWLGDRVGVALRPGGTSKQPNVAVAVQVKDEGKAQDGLTRLLACDRSGATDLRMKNGYAVITPKGQGDSTVKAVDSGNLAANATFAGDMAALGEEGVMSIWFDAGRGLSEAQKLSTSRSPMPASFAAVKGRVAAAVRFDPSYVELAGVTRGFSQNGKAIKGNGEQLTNLPDDTVAALHIAGADQGVDAAWPELKKQIDAAASGGGQGDVIGQLESQLGIKLPDDLKVLLGSSMTIALPDQSFGGQQPVVGAKIVSSDAKRADELVGKIEDAANASGFLTRKVEGNKLYLATTPDYAAKLSSGGKLGDTEAFKAAVSDPAKSVTSMFINLDKLEKQYLPSVPADSRAAVQALKAVGMSASMTGAGDGVFSLRVVGN